MINTQTKPALLSWLLLSVAIIVAQLFNEVYQYSIAIVMVGVFILELQFLSKGRSVEDNGYITKFSIWGYTWRTLTILFCSTVLVITLAMIFHPDDFIHHRLLTLVAITINNILLIWLIYRKR